MDSIKNLRTYFICQNSSEKSFSELNSIHNVTLNNHRQSARQTMIEVSFLIIITLKSYKIRNT